MMIYSKLPNITIEKIRPLAYMKDGDKLFLAIEIANIQDDERFAFIESPDFCVERLYGLNMIESAVIKHEYFPLVQNEILNYNQEFSGFISYLEKQPFIL